MPRVVISTQPSMHAQNVLLFLAPLLLSTCFVVGHREDRTARPEGAAIVALVESWGYSGTNSGPRAPQVGKGALGNAAKRFRPLPKTLYPEPGHQATAQTPGCI